MENPRFSFLQFYPGLMNSLVLKSGYEHGVKKHRLFKWFINCVLRTVVCVSCAQGGRKEGTERNYTLCWLTFPANRQFSYL
jgi:hypothetical protein